MQYQVILLFFFLNSESESVNSLRRIDLETLMYSPKLLESTFAEINFKKKPNIVVGTIYRHHALSPIEFSNSLR